ncbi:MAG: glucosaminidase domain-containing protein [Clostridium sp.]|nr:glucosaminidase domain-containing protein [Prevotella sp.]MCM1428466.1 glucosaminidase domain-containing protein [Clostridium sp.]
MSATISNIAFADRYTEYIEEYSGMAVEQQERYGIPASITLAQGLLESGAGSSTLATQGNNHFGIKCHSDWHGETMLRDDDAPDECFRVYKSASESFEDHSKFLCRKRYSPLFELERTDYAGWARTLRRCGYATDPNYGERLIAIIERYSLYGYDTPTGREIEETAGFIFESLRNSHTVRKSRGLHYIIATPGDTYGSIAREFHIDKKKLLTYNDVASDMEVRPWEEVFLEEKRDEAPKGVKKATIGADESIHSVSQRYGMKLSRLKELNPRAKDRPGEIINLR